MNFKQDVVGAIEKADVVSFDIFDTLLLRDFYLPIDLFKYIEDHHGIKDFQKRRIAAELECNQNKKGKEEITYEDIYTVLNVVDPELELSAELKCCLANTEIKCLYESALEMGKKIIAISDMYLDENFILSLLSKCGYDKIDQIYISSAYGKRKSTGNLYKIVLEDLKIAPSELLHIGDNKVSDYQQAKACGIEAIYYKAKREQLSQAKNSTVLQKLQVLNHLDASLYLSLIANKYEMDEDREYWEQFGFEYAGLVVYKFVEWIYETSKKKDIDRIYFMARDGEIIKKVFEYLYPDTKIQCSYLEASRRTFFIASIKSLDQDTLNYLTSGAPDTSLRSFVERLELSGFIEKAEKYFGDINVSLKNNKDREKLKKFFKRNEEYIVKEALKERENLRNYLLRMEFFKDDKCALVDVGWNSSSQNYLESIFDKKVYGLYFGVKKGAYTQDKIQGYYFDRGEVAKRAKVIESNLEIVELFFSGTHPSVVKIDDILNPVYFSLFKEESERIANAKCIHLGVMNFTKEFSKLSQKYNAFTTIDTLDLVIENILLKPNLKDILNIGKVSFTSSFGNSAYRKILQNPELTFVGYLLNTINKKSKENSNYWLSGWLQYQKLKNSKSLYLINRVVWLSGKIKRCRFHGWNLCMKKIFAKIDIKNENS